MPEPFPLPPDVPRLPSGELDVGTLRRTNPARLDQILREAEAWYAKQRKPVGKAAAGGTAIARRPPGRPPKPAPAVEPPKRPRGRPRKQDATAPAACDPTMPAETKPERKEESASSQSTIAEPAVERPTAAGSAPVLEAERPAPEPFKIQLPPDADLEPVTPKPPPKSREPEPPAPEVALPADLEKIRMIDEYGELDRQMQLRSTGVARYETLKKAIKSWFDDAPADADGIVEGEYYLLRLSARERERRIRDNRALVEEIGLDKFLELATVALGLLEDLIGKARVDALTEEKRSGSRRIKAVPKHPAAVAARPS